MNLASVRLAAPSTGLPALIKAGFTAMVVDDHPLARASTVARLRSIGARQVIEATSIAEARARAGQGAPRDIAVLGVELADGNGLDLLAELRAAGWRRLMVLSAVNDPASVRAAFAAGARGYLLRSANSSTMVNGVRRVLGGELFADPSVPPPLVHRVHTLSPATGGATGLRSLSQREIEVLQLVANGQSNKEIGVALTVSALTVKSHLARVARKLGTGDRAEMVAIALRGGVID